MAMAVSVTLTCQGVTAGGYGSVSHPDMSGVTGGGYGSVSVSHPDMSGVTAGGYGSVSHPDMSGGHCWWLWQCQSP